MTSEDPAYLACFPHHTALRNCIEKFHSDTSKCQEYCDIYKECRRKEREARLERIRSRSFFEKNSV